MSDTNNNSSAKTQERVFIAVHGVGNSNEGTTKAAVSSALKKFYGEEYFESNNRVLDYSWNSLVEFPLKDGHLDTKQVRKIAKAWKLASRLKKKTNKSIKKEKYESQSNFSLEILELLSHLFWLILPVVSLAGLALPDIGLVEKVWAIFVPTVLVLSILGITAGLLSGDSLIYLLRRIFLVITLSPILFFLWLSSYIYNPIKQFEKGPFLLVFMSFGLFLNVCFMTVYYVFYKLGYVEALPFTEYGLYVAGSLLLFFIQPVIGHLVKIIADVALYLGDEEYRRQLQEKMDQLLESLPKNSQVVLLGHSLGSVISLHSLMSSRSWRRMEDVIFVTGGSPLKRLIWLFFDGSFVGSNAKDCTDTIKKNIKRFSWINVYRPFDQVGTSIGLSKNGVGEEKMMWSQWHRILTAHTNYFGDTKVVAEVEKMISRRKVHEGVLSELPRTKNYCYVRDNELALKSTVFNTVIGLVMFLAAGSVLYLGADSIVKQSSIRAMLDPTLSSDGMETSGNAFYRVEVAGRNGQIIHKFRFEWKHPDTLTSYQAKASESMVPPYQFDSEKFIKFIDCEQKYTIGCIKNNVIIRFLPDKPTVFTLPEYEAKNPEIKYILKTTFELFATIMGAVALSIILFLFLYRFLFWIDEFEDGSLED